MSRVAILFDFDDTLVETWQHKWIQHQEVAQRFYGKYLDESTIRSHWGKPSKELVRHFYGDSYPVEQMLKNFHSLDNEYPKTIKPSALQVLPVLSSRGYVMGIVSNGSRESVHNDIKRLRIPVEHFAFVHVYEDTQAYKPDPRVFDLALSQLTKDNIKEIVYVGDSLADFRAAKGAGLGFIGITSGFATKDDFAEFGITRIVDELSELLDIL